VTGEASAGALLREARTRAGLSQAQLAARAGVAQSVVSVYESGRRQPSVPTLAALVAATGHDLDLQLRPAPSALTGPLGTRLHQRRGSVLRAADRRGIRVRGVFGSVARGQDTASSDIDLLVTLPPGLGLIGLGRVRQDLENILGAQVDLIPETDLKPGVRDTVLADLVPL
jgi:predicted nucleotidyltransferase/DNA-binding XRE family transcriptional regulator